MAIYKYVVADRVDVLQNGLIRFTQPTALNDPFELQPYFDSLISEQDALVNMGAVDLRESLVKAYNGQSEDIKAEVSLATFLDFMADLIRTEDGAKAIQSGFSMALGTLKAVTPVLRETIATTLASKIGILSLTEDPVCMPMWAHYADNHSGMVICFDKQHEFFHSQRSESDDFFHLRQVVYQAGPQSRALVELDGEEVLLRKEPAWSYENEWRILAPVAAATKVIDGSEPIYLFRLPSSCITGVILGSRSSPELEGAVRALATDDPRFRNLAINRAVLDQHQRKMRNVEA